MKYLLAPLLIALLTGCPTTDVVEVKPGWQKQPIKIVGCKPVVEYSGRSFSSKGVDIPVPQLGGSVKVGEFTYKPETLNTLYRNVAILDALRLQYCGDRVAAAQISQAAFNACNERVMDQEAKIAALAISATQGEAAVEEAVHKYGTSSPEAPAPKDASTKNVDAIAASGLQEKANGNAPMMAGAAPGAAPAASSTTTLPPQVAAIVRQVPKETLLKMARRPAPSPASKAH
jgi:hypothetical protein